MITGVKSFLFFVFGWQRVWDLHKKVSILLVAEVFIIFFLLPPNYNKITARVGSDSKGEKITEVGSQYQIMSLSKTKAHVDFTKWDKLRSLSTQNNFSG